MADTMDIIISAVDSASEVFQSIMSNVTDFGSSVSDVVSAAGDEFDSVADNVSGFQDAVDNIDESQIEELADSLGMSTDEFERLIQTGVNLGSIPFDDATAAALELDDALEQTTEQMEELGSAGDVKGAETFMDMANSMKDAMYGAADSAGNFQDSMTRVSLAAEGAGISASDMKDAVSSLSEETGRAGGTIRESMIAMTSAGITDLDSMKAMMQGVSGQAFILQTDVEGLANKYAGLAMKSTLSEKSLKGTGITFDELSEAMGMNGATADEVKEKWKELDVNQRAAILGGAASMNEGKDANDAFKTSWQGLQEQVDIAKGKFERIVGSVILPVLIPAMKLAGDILQGVGDTLQYVMDSPLGGIISVLGTGAGVILIAVTAFSALKTILGFLKIEAGLAAIETTALAFAEEIQAGGSIASAAANAIGATGFGGLAAAAWSAALAVWAAIAPLLPFIAAAVLVAVAIYEVGKAFGWWDNVGEMIDAIKDGIMRLWNAFINHPDVQAALTAISNALSTLWGWIQQAGQAVLDFFGINESGKFDIVQSLINGIGNAWNAIRGPIIAVISIFSTVLGSLAGLVTGHMSATTAITNIWNALKNNLPVIFNAILSLQRTIWGMILKVVVNLVKSLVTNVVSWFKQLPGKIYNVLLNVVSRIRNAIQQWINAAVQKVSQFVSNVTSPFRNISSGISSALSGVISAITKPFQDAWNALKPIVDKIKGAMSIVPGLAAGGEINAAGGEIDFGDNPLFNINNGKYVTESNENVTIDINHNLVLDLINVPAHIDTATLSKMLQDKKVLRELTNNLDFQTFDSEVKDKLLKKSIRARGR